jgi:ABC-2 type transport system permease protein
MKTAAVIASRELASFFRLPVGWIAIALYLLLTGIVFSAWVLHPGEPATLRAFFSISVWILLPVAPAISMRLLSEEIRSGTLEPLMTSPVSDAAIVLGKFIAAVAFLALMIAPTAAYTAILFAVSDPAPDAGPILAGYLSLLLVGSAYLSVGLLASALTSNQTLAFLGTLLFLLLLLMLATMQNAIFMTPGAKTAAHLLSFPRRINDFARGVIDTSHVIFFAAWSAWFVTMAVVAVQMRRWR